MKIGYICTPFHLMKELEKARHKMAIDNIIKHGLISGIIVGNRITVPITVTVNGESISFHNALIDTGANYSAVNAAMPDASDEVLLLTAYDKTRVKTCECTLTIKDKKKKKNYSILFKPDKEYWDPLGIDAIIGLDLIQCGEFRIFQKDGRAHFTLEM